MPFGLYNAPSTFTTLMNTMFHQEMNEFVIVYIDDIFISSKMAEEHAKRLEIVLGKLREHKLYANGEKSEFESKKLDGTQTKWPIHEKEMFVVVYCLKTWQHYLGLHKTKVFTNNMLLKYFESQAKITTKQLK